MPDQEQKEKEEELPEPAQPATPPGTPQDNSSMADEDFKDAVDEQQQAPATADAPPKAPNFGLGNLVVLGGTVAVGMAVLAYRFLRSLVHWVRGK